jgi:oxaloacetate decarboxylase gamma subunit
MEIEQLLVQSLQLLGLGMGAVFIILVLLIGLITLVSRIVPEESSPTLAATPPPARPAVNNDHIAAISAAIQQYRKNRNP